MGGCEFQSQPSQTKDLKIGSQNTQVSGKFESDIGKPERWFSSEQMFEQLPMYSNWELNVLEFHNVRRFLVDNSSTWELKRLIWKKNCNITLHHNYNCDFDLNE